MVILFENEVKKFIFLTIQICLDSLEKIKICNCKFTAGL